MQVIDYTGATVTAIAIVHKEFVLEQLRQGRMLGEIAPLLGITKQSVSTAMQDEPEYKAALVDQAESMIEESKVMLWDAREQTDISRARECARFAFRYAESINPAKWAPQSKVQVTHTDDLGDRLRRAQLREREIRGERLDAPQLARPAGAVDAEGPATLDQDGALRSDTPRDSGVGGTGVPPDAPSNDTQP